MSVILHTSSELPDSSSYQSWLAVTGTNVLLDNSNKLPNLAEKLEQAFMENRETWWGIGKELGREPTAAFAHMPTGGAFGSDFGVMLAWSQLVQNLASAADTCLVVCDDPWLFRHLQGIPGIMAGKRPNLMQAEFKLAIRGWLARTKTALKSAHAALSVKSKRNIQQPGGTAILVYGHPRSTPDGFDAYFGNLMTEEPKLTRVLHVDCGVARARELAGGGRTSSLHQWGCPLFALSLIWTRWHNRHPLTDNKYAWLIRRSIKIENSGGGPAMTLWQSHCQDRWLERVKPARVCWPWENHAWERNLCRSAKKLEVKTLGYQHTVVGPHQINYSTATNPDGLESIPDMVICDGPAYRDEVAAWGVPAERLTIGGAFRFKKFTQRCFDPSGPIFVPLSAIPAAAQSQIQAAKKLSDLGKKVLVKEHPMYPVSFRETENMTRTHETLTEQSGLSAVLFCTGTSGLEAILMKVPAYRLILDDRIAINILPASVNVPSITLEDVEQMVRADTAIVSADWNQILAEPDMNIWHSLLFGDMHADNNTQQIQTQKAL